MHRSRLSLSLLLLSSLFSPTSLWAESVTFPSLDGLIIEGELKEVRYSEQFILLFHQAGSSLGEYTEIASRLNRLGFSTLAINQRSGRKMNGVVNTTYQRAVESKRKTDYWSARQDLIASLLWVEEKFSPKKLIVWGSSYSASLVITLASEEDVAEKIDGYLAFSPGEYLKEASVQESAKTINVPLFITSARSEKQEWSMIYDAAITPKKSFFLPQTAGHHGSSALWSKYSDSEDYWVFVEKFLQNFRE